MTSILLLVHLILQAQVTIVVNSVPVNTPAGSTIYIAGSFNGWAPGNADYALKTNPAGKPQITINATGTIQFKFTRGSWPTVEGNATGGYLPNRTFVMGSTDTLKVTIQSWEDLGGGPNTTAAENVKIISTSFLMPQFDRTRRIWVYLPPDYATSTKRYPVLYMHDGQNLFDTYTAFAGEWEVDETLNRLAAAGKQVPIVVGIDNGGSFRTAEYTPWRNAQYGGGDGEKYARFIIETLKPYIDQNYRTLSGRENTGVMGSSLGGLITHYMALKYQNVFGKAGVFSPSFWFSDSAYILVQDAGRKFAMRYYMMGGTNESSGLVQQMNNMMGRLTLAGFSASEITLKTVPGGQHNEFLWRTQFEEAFVWLFSELLTPTRQPKPGKAIRVVSSKDSLTVFDDAGSGPGSFRVKMHSVSGSLVFETSAVAGRPVSVPARLKGIYIVHIEYNGDRISRKIIIL